MRHGSAEDGQLVEIGVCFRLRIVNKEWVHLLVLCQVVMILFILLRLLKSLIILFEV